MKITWLAASGAKYSTELHPIGEPMPAQAGVYVVCQRAKKQKEWAAIYVGETDDFNEQLYLNLKSHHRYSCFVQQGATHVCILAIAGDRSARVPAETDLRNFLDPPCNWR